MNSCQLLFQKLVWSVREQGGVQLLARGVGMLAREVTQGGQHLFYGTCCELSGDTATIPPHHFKLEYYASREAIPDTFLEQLCQHIHRKGMQDRVVHHYLDRLLWPFQQGGHMSVASRDGRLAAYLWFMTGNGQYASHFPFFPLAPNDGLLLAGFTFEEFRGQNLMPILVRFNAEALQQRGVQRVYGSCKIWNGASIRGLTKAGLGHYGTARPLGMFGRRVVIWQDKAGC